MFITEWLEVLQNSVIKNLESGCKGLIVPHFHEYIDRFLQTARDDCEAEKIKGIKDDILTIDKAFVSGMPLTQNTITVEVPVHDLDYSPHFGIPVAGDARFIISVYLNEALNQCDMALIARCGFGKFSTLPEKIIAAKHQLMESVEKEELPTTFGLLPISLHIFWSNCNLLHGILADGLWKPFQAFGLLKCESLELVIGFVAIMDYGTSIWSFSQLNTNVLMSFQKEVPLFSKAFKKISGVEFDWHTCVETDQDLIDFLKTSPHLLSLVNRMCGRWKY